MTETWRPIPGYENRYDVSDHGRVRSWVANRGETLPHILADAPTKDGGYRHVSLSDGNHARSHRVHVLVMAAFVGRCPPGEEVRHRDGNPARNVLSNLAYGTPSQNQLDSVAHGTHAAAAKTHCPQQHPYDDENTYITPTGKRDCRECRREAGRRRYAREKEAV